MQTFTTQRKPNKRQKNGFNITEFAVTTAIIGTLGSIAYPNYIASQDRAKCSETQATVVSIPPIVGAYIDATGEAPTTWDDLSSIAAVMTSDGPATDDLKTPITLPNSNYKLSVEGPSESTYVITANCYVEDPTPTGGLNGNLDTLDPLEPLPSSGDLTGNDTESDLLDEQIYASKYADKYRIRSCFNISNGASDLRRGKGTDSANTPNCS